MGSVTSTMGISGARCRAAISASTISELSGRWAVPAAPRCWLKRKRSSTRSFRAPWIRLEDLVEDLLFDHRRIIGVTVGEVGEEAEVGSGDSHGITTIDQVRRQRFDRLVATDGRPQPEGGDAGEERAPPPRPSPGPETGEHSGLGVHSNSRKTGARRAGSSLMSPVAPAASRVRASSGSFTTQ